MMRRTHAAAGLALGLGLASVYHQTALNAALLGLLTQAAALLPDLDIKLHIQHRTVTHSLLAMAIISLATWHYVPQFLAYIAGGYGSHLLLDFLTVWGIPLFWPVQKRFRLMKISTGGRIDALCAVGALCAALYFGAILIHLKT